MEITMIFEKIINNCPPGSIIPKPRAKKEFLIKGVGTRRGEEALIPYIPNNKNPNKPYQKGITRSEFEKAYQELMEKGIFTKKWFDIYLSDCSSEGSCNFTTVGGLFQKLGLVEYVSPGIYKLL